MCIARKQVIPAHNNPKDAHQCIYTHICGIWGNKRRTWVTFGIFLPVLLLILLSLCHVLLNVHLTWKPKNHSRLSMSFQEYFWIIGEYLFWDFNITNSSFLHSNKMWIIFGLPYKCTYVNHIREIEILTIIWRKRKPKNHPSFSLFLRMSLRFCYLLRNSSSTPILRQKKGMNWPYNCWNSTYNMFWELIKRIREITKNSRTLGN